MIKLLKRLLLIFIALEVLLNVTAYLRVQVVQIELVLLTAMTDVARKAIVLLPGNKSKPQLMPGFGMSWGWSCRRLWASEASKT